MVEVIREAVQSERDAVLALVGEAFTEAFGAGEGQEVAVLARELMDDPAAEALSLVALENEIITGNVIFSRASLEDAAHTPAAILAPLAVLPGHQGRGVGGRLVEAGLQRLAGQGVPLAFVFGHPEYYPRFGFQPAGSLGFTPPYPLAEEFASAWMVRYLDPALAAPLAGLVRCCPALDRAEYWR